MNRSVTMEETRMAGKLPKEDAQLHEWWGIMLMIVR